MDPNATLKLISRALQVGDTADASENAEHLYRWLVKKKGFWPRSVRDGDRDVFIAFLSVLRTMQTHDEEVTITHDADTVSRMLLARLDSLS